MRNKHSYEDRIMYMKMLEEGFPTGFPELPLRILPVFQRGGSINCTAVLEPVPVPVYKLHDFAFGRLCPENDFAHTKPFLVGQFKEAYPERVFEKNGQRALAQAFSNWIWMMVRHLLTSSRRF